MSFIDYNFFPILFFLGWNILTTVGRQTNLTVPKQFRPTIDTTSNYKTLPALSVFSLKVPFSKDTLFSINEKGKIVENKTPKTNLINQKTLQLYPKHQKKSDILEFIPEFKFLSENQKLIDILQANSINLENPINNAFVFKNTFFKYTIPTISKKEGFIINYIAKPTQWLLNQEKTHFFTNHNLITNNWKKDFKLNFFNFTYQPKRKTFFSFFSYKMKPLFYEIESSVNIALRFPNIFFRAVPRNRFFSVRWPDNRDLSGPTKVSQFENNIFFKGLYSSQKNVSLENRIKSINTSILQQQDLKHETSYNQKPINNNVYSDHNSMFKGSNFVWIKTNTKKLSNINFIQKRRSKIRLLLRVPNQKIYSLNRFQIALCFSKILKSPIFFNDNYGLNLTSSFSKDFENPSVFKTSVNTKVPELNNSMYNTIKNKLEPQTTPAGKRLRRKTQFLDNSLVKPDQKTDDVDNYKTRKKNWYMKTQFFQHIGWNMKHKPWSLKDYTICQNYPCQKIYAGSWYCENLSAGPDSIKKYLTGDPNYYLNHSQSNKQNPFLAKSQKMLESDIGIYSLAHKLSSVGFRNANNSSNIYPWRYNDSYRYNFQNMNLYYNLIRPSHNWDGPENFLGFSNFTNTTGDSSEFFRENKNVEQNFTRNKETHSSNTLQRIRQPRKFLDFQNPVFSKTYAPIFQPQGLNLLSFITKSFLNIIPNSILNAQSMAFFDSLEETQETKNFFSPYQIQSIISDYSHYLSAGSTSNKQIGMALKNSKINTSFLDVPRVGRPLKSLSNINNNNNLQNTPKKFKILHDLYHKLPINGIHSNPYPWITQNAFDRWSTSGSLWTLSNSSFFSPPENRSLVPFSINRKKAFKGRLKNKFPHHGSLKGKLLRFFSGLADPNSNKIGGINSRDPKTKPDYQKNDSLFISTSLNKFQNTNSSILKTSVDTKFPRTSQKVPLKDFKSQLYFTEKPSCIKKPSIFFSSFRYLPYSFISETFSKKNTVFPQANLSLFSLVNSSKSQLEKPTKNVYNHLSVPQNFLFNNNILKENEKKQILPIWKGSLQHKFFSLKPLSTFVKKEVGYQTSFFSWVPIINSKTNQKTEHWPNNKEKFIQKRPRRETDLVPIQKNTWKIFPPLFQPFTFRFIDLNLPRTSSSEFLTSMVKLTSLNTNKSKSSNRFQNTKGISFQAGPFPLKEFPSNLLNKGYKNLVKRGFLKKPFQFHSDDSLQVKQPIESNILPQDLKWNVIQKNFFRFSIPFYFSDFFHFPVNNQFDTKYTFNNYQNKKPMEFYESLFPLTNIATADEFKPSWTNNQKGPALSGHAWRLERKNRGSLFNEAPKFQNSKIVVYGEKPLLKNRTAHGPPLKNQKESISLPSYLKNITNQNYQNLCPNNLNELYSVFWILFNKTLFIYLSLHYLRKFISFLGTEYIRNLFKIFVTMKFIDGNILSIIKTFQDFNFQLNQQNVIDIKVNKQLKEIKRN